MPLFFTENFRTRDGFLIITIGIRRWLLKQILRIAQRQTKQSRALAFMNLRQRQYLWPAVVFRPSKGGYVKRI